uniref:Uncharacterized protein n=1 Tax=Anguilla anguilla TaxID=7936 RepID=A0A0E9QZ38_ANGAN
MVFLVSVNDIDRLTFFYLLIITVT